MSIYWYERQVAEEAVLRASILTKQVQSTVDYISKGDNSPVTVADYAAQAIIIGILRQAFPDDNFLGEEDSKALRADRRLCNEVWKLVQSASTSSTLHATCVDEMLDWIDLGGRGQGGDGRRTWIMDPIDGTATFLKGQQYAVSLSLVEHGREVIGVLGCPNISTNMTQISENNVDRIGFGIMLTAIRNLGATVRTMSSKGLDEPYPMRFREACNSDKLHIVDSIACQVTRHDATAKLARRFNSTFPETELWSSHIRYASLIIGGANALFWVPAAPTSKMHIWDHAGSQLIFSELGGKVTDLDGKPLDFGAGRDLNRNRGLVVARDEIHHDLLVAMRNILGDNE